MKRKKMISLSLALSVVLSASSFAQGGITLPTPQANPNTANAPLDLATGSEFLQRANLRAQDSIDLSKTMNFSDCLNFDIDFKGPRVCRRGIFPSPAVDLTFKYQEPTALLEAGCLRGQSFLKDSQGLGSRLLSGGVSKTEGQKCVEPLQDKWGERRRYFNDTLVWSVGLQARFESSGTKIQVLQSYTCEAISKLGFIARITNFVQNVKITNFTNLGQSLKDGFSNVTDGIAKQFNDFKNGLINLPNTIKTQVTDAFSSVRSTVTGFPGKVSNFGNSLQTGLTDFGTGIKDISNRVTSFSPSEALSKVQEQAGGLSSKLQAPFTSLGDVNKSLGDRLSSITKIPGVSSLPGVGVVTSTIGQLQQSGEIVTAFAEVDMSKENLAGIQSAVQGVSGISSALAAPVRNTANFLKSTFLALENNSPDGLQYAALGNPAFPNTGNIAQIVQDLEQAADMLDEIDGEIQSFAGIQEDLNHIINQLGGGGPPPEEETVLKLVNGRVATDGFLENGGSQAALRQSVYAYEGNIDALLQIGERALQWATDLGSAEEPELCRAFHDFTNSFDKLTTLDNTVNESDFFTGVYPEATYLSLGYPQYVQEDRPSASCPLTSAGYTLIPQVVGEATRRYSGCRQVCTVGDAFGGTQTCEWEAEPGKYVPAGTSCNNNRLSELKEDNYYPSCNGITQGTTTSGGGEVGSITVSSNTYSYNARFDHRQFLENRRLSELRREVNRARSATEQSLNATKGYMQRKGVSVASCEPYRPIQTPNIEDLTFVAPKSSLDTQVASIMKSQLSLANVPAVFGHQKVSHEKNVRAVRVAFSEFQDQLGAELKRDAVNPPLNLGDNLLSSETLNGQALAQVESLVDLFNQGAIQQRIINKIGRFYPFGLQLGFDSSDTQWAKHRFGKEGLLVTAVNSTPAGILPWLLCSGGSQLNALTGTQAINLGALASKTGCIGNWGTADEHGWTYGKNQFKNRMLTAVRGRNVAVKLKAIKPNLLGTPEFNLDYPYLYANSSQSPYNKAVLTGIVPGKGSHQGSGCYEEGSASSKWYSPGEKGALSIPDIGQQLQTTAESLANNVKSVGTDQTSDLGGANIVATSWKKTACRARIDVGSIAGVLAGGIPSPCKFDILY